MLYPVHCRCNLDCRYYAGMNKDTNCVFNIDRIKELGVEHIYFSRGKKCKADLNMIMDNLIDCDGKLVFDYGEW